jgi:chromate transporter
VLWLAPVAAVVAIDPGGGVQTDMARFFTGAAIVTFGGAYAALAYTADHAQGAWVTSAQMADGLGLAESTPGPLILVLQFVAFLGAHQNAGTLSPVASALFASAVMLWTTFAPCFLWIFLLAPWMETLRANRALASALAALGAAVVGVIADLAGWFASHVLFREVEAARAWGAIIELPRWSSVDALGVAVAACALFLFTRTQWPVIAVIAACALATGAVRLAAGIQ